MSLSSRLHWIEHRLFTSEGFFFLKSISFLYLYVQEGTASCSPLYGVTGHSKLLTNALARLERDACIMTENKISVLTKNMQRLGEGEMLLIETFDQSAQLLLFKDWDDFYFNYRGTAMWRQASKRGVFKWKLGDPPHTTHTLQSPTFKKFSHNLKIIYRNGAILLQCEQGVDEIAAW